MLETISIIDTVAIGEKGVVAAYLVSGKENALIDMGHRSSADVVIRQLSALGIHGDDLHYLLPTHVHLDHAGSCGTLTRKYPNASVLVHPRGELHLVDPTRLVKGAGELFGARLMQRYGLPEAIEKRRVRGIADGETISLGKGATLRTIWTPGHAPHHLSYLLEGEGVLFSGDVVGVRHPTFPVLVPTTPPPSFSFDKAIESLHRLTELPITRLCTPHFGTLDEARELLRQNVSALGDWKTKLEAFISRGLSVEEMTKSLTEETCQRIGRSMAEVPEYLRVMIGVSVLGFVGYLKSE